jgi:Fe-Mn family superoxide dismutase
LLRCRWKRSSKPWGLAPIFNNAAQHWNHSFYWQCLAPQKEHRKPSGRLAKEIGEAFGDFAAFKKTFSETAGSLFGSGWAWLVQKSDGSLAVEQTSNADNPLTAEQKPLFTCDVWEHAYYIDYRNERPKYVDAFWKIVNWQFVESNLD